MNAVQKRKGKAEIIQVMRGIAALGVVYFHTEYGPWRSADWGVDFFFILSGYFIMASTEQNRGGYWKNRLIRIVPLYYLMTIVTMTGYVVLPGFFRSTVVNAETVIKSFLFIPCYARSEHIYPIYSIGWTVNLEMFFYLVFFAAMKISHPNRGRLVMVMLIVLVFLGQVFEPENAVLCFWTSKRVVNFIVGVGIFELRNAIEKVSIKEASCFLGMTIALFCCFFGCYLIGDGFDRLWNTFFGGILLVFCLLQKELRCSRLLVHLGDMSYSIYLTHFYSVGIVCRMLMRSKNITFVNTLLVFVSVAVAVLCSEIVYRVFEIRGKKLLMSALRESEQ